MCAAEALLDGTITDAFVNWRCAGHREQSFLFSKLNKLFFGYFDPDIIFLDNENK